MVDSVATVWLPVQDMTRAVAFYRDTLGLTVTSEDADWSEIDADGLMIGRGAYGRPWLLNQVMTWFATGRRIADPSIDEQYTAIAGHYEAMLEHYGIETGVNMARKHIGWYTKGLHGSAEFRNKANFIDDAAQVLGEIDRFYGPILRRQAA